MIRALSLILVGTLACTLGCSREAPVRPVPGSEGAGGSALGVRSVRVLDEDVNMMEPLDVAVVDGAVTVAFASRGHETTRLVLDPDSLETRARSSFAHPEHPAHKIPPCTVGRKRAARVTLGGESLETWTNFDARVVAARPTGDAVPISPPEWAVVGRPHAVAIDDHRAVVVFFGGNDEHYRVVAVIVDAAPGKVSQELSSR